MATSATANWMVVDGLCFNIFICILSSKLIAREASYHFATWQPQGCMTNVWRSPPAA